MRTRATIRAEVGESFLTCESLISMDEKATPLFKEIAFFLSGPDDTPEINVKVIRQRQLLPGFYVGLRSKEGLIHFVFAGEDLSAQIFSVKVWRFRFRAHFIEKCIRTMSSRRLLFQLPQSLFDRNLCPEEICFVFLRRKRSQERRAVLRLKL